MKKFVSVRILFFVLLLLCGGCSKEGKITGKIFDNFGDPLKEALVQIEGTQFKTTTTGSGEYAIPFAPGNFEISITKNGYGPIRFPLSVTTTKNVPIEDKVLYMIPPTPDLYVVINKQYVKLKTGVYDNLKVNNWNIDIKTMIKGEFSNVSAQRHVNITYGRDFQDRTIYLLMNWRNGDRPFVYNTWLSNHENQKKYNPVKTVKINDNFQYCIYDLPKGKYVIEGGYGKNQNLENLPNLLTELPPGYELSNNLRIAYPFIIN